jgi:hypothetical protein
MVSISDIDPQSNEYFFITGLREDTFKAGRNSFVVNCTPKILAGQELEVSATNAAGKPLTVSLVKGNRSGFTNSYGQTYVIVVPADTDVGIGNLTVRGVGIDTGNYTGSFAYYRGKAYPTTPTTRLPLIAPPVGATAFEEAQITWSRNYLIDTSTPTDSEVRFFDFPELTLAPKIFNAPEYPVDSYRMASGSCSGIAVLPKNNSSRDFDVGGDLPIYQLFHSGGTKFSSAMEGEDIRIKNPFVRSFTYTNYSNNEITYNGVLRTDFVGKINKVVNDTTLLITIPFAVANEIVNRTNAGSENEDSQYNRNNLVDPYGYNQEANPANQSNFIKKNFFVLSIGNAEFEVVYKSIPTILPQSSVDGDELNQYKKTILEMEFGNLRALCGNLSRYEIYGRTMSAPETKTVLASGKIEPEETLVLNNFNNGYYSSAGSFYNGLHAHRYWLTSSAALVFSQTHTLLINGAQVGHAGNSAQTDYIILKDDTTGTSRTPAIVAPSFMSKSYWYATREALINSQSVPSSSYDSADSVVGLPAYVASRELLTNGENYDSNPIKLRSSTLYRFSLNVRHDQRNTRDSKLYIYFVSGDTRKQIAMIDNAPGTLTDGVFSTTFFSDVTQYGTLIIVPVGGYWHISDLSLSPHAAMDYSPDSFRVKVSCPNFAPNELYEVEAELYDGGGRLAYGKGAYSFNYNKMFLPLKKQFFVNPLGGDLIYDGGNAFTTPQEYTSTVDGGGN